MEVCDITVLLYKMKLFLRSTIRNGVTKMLTRMFILSVCIILSEFLQAQVVELKLDTSTLVFLRQVDTSSNVIMESSKYFVINHKIYSADNFPFMSLKAKGGEIYRKYRLYIDDFTPVINRKSINKLLDAIYKKDVLTLDDLLRSTHVNKENAELVEFLNCVNSNGQRKYLISVQSSIIAYFLIDCGMRRGTSQPVYCSEKVELNETPIILNVINLIR